MQCLHQPPEYTIMHYSVLYNERQLQHCCVLLLSTTVKFQTRSSVWIRSAYSNSNTVFSIWSNRLRFAQQYFIIYVHVLRGRARGFHRVKGRLTRMSFSKVLDCRWRRVMAPRVFLINLSFITFVLDCCEL